MKQRFKTVYFADYPAESPQKKSLTLAFGEKDSELYDSVKALSSQELREFIGYSTFTSLQQAAEDDGLAINTYCLRLLRKSDICLRDATQQYYLPGLAEEVGPLIDPLQATFKGGQAEPLHAWYPFLEGYSPRFVEQILQEFAPQAARILDPFAGTGTTPLTATRLGKEAFYCELNPLMQYLTHAKAVAQTLSDSIRQQLAQFLRSQAEELEAFCMEADRDSTLESAYTDTFGNSRFFDETTFDQILRVRSAIDRLACTQPQEARFVTVATLASLILPKSH